MEFINRAKAIKETGLSYLGSVNSSAKIVKNGKVSKQKTYIIYLAPAKVSGHNVCLHSTPECRLGCLATSGRVKMEVAADRNVIQSARVKKTNLFFEEQEFFMRWMIAEITAKKALAEKEGFGFSARLNGTSDIEWENINVDGKNIFEIFPDVQFYDYTKNSSRYFNPLPINYHLTFSYSGRNEEISKKLLAKGHNVAVIFNIDNYDQFPTEWNGFKVINGDLTDYRPDDGNGVVVGLKWKNIANKEANETIKKSVFVVQV